MKYRVRPNRTVYLPGGGLWARAGEYIEMDGSESWHAIAARKLCDIAPDYRGDLVPMPMARTDIREAEPEPKPEPAPVEPKPKRKYKTRKMDSDLG